MAKTTLLQGGTVITMDESIGDLATGDVLIEGDRIVSVAPHIDAAADETIDARGTIVLPGLIDTHVHLWQTAIRGISAGAWGFEYFPIVHPFAARLRPDDMHVATYGGAVEALANGVTTVFDFCHATNSPEHADASVDALSQSGVRALFGFGLRDRPEVAHRAFSSLDDRIADVRRLHAARHGGDDGRIQIAVAMNNPDHVDAETAAREYGCARDLGIRSTLHSDLRRQVSEAHERGLLGPDVLWVHCNGIGDDELELLRDYGGVISATPEAEASAGAEPAVGRALSYGVPTVLGIDIITAVNTSLLMQMRVTYALERVLHRQRVRRQPREPGRARPRPAVDARRLLKMATIDGAAALGLDSKVGSLTPGKLADVLVVADGPFGRGAGDAASHLIFQTSRAEVETVIVGGQIRVRNGSLVDVDLPALKERLEESRDYLTGRGDVSWPELSEADRAKYEATLGRPEAEAPTA